MSLGAALATLFASCVPSDTSKETPRGGVLATLHGQALYPREPRRFEDGWNVVVDRVTLYSGVTVRPNVSTNTTGSSAACYSSGNYAPFKLIRADVVNTSEVRAINVGTCAAEVSISFPYFGDNDFAEFGPGVVAADAQAFQNHALRNTNESDTAQHFGASLHLTGSATKEARSLRFDIFLSPNAFFDPRTKFESGQLGQVSDNLITIVANDKVDLEFEWNDYVFFRTDTVAGAALQFEAWAFADEHGNRDGLITTDELEDVRILPSEDTSHGNAVAPGRFSVSTSENYPGGYSGSVAMYVAGQAPFGWTRVR